MSRPCNQAHGSLNSFSQSLCHYVLLVDLTAHIQFKAGSSLAYILWHAQITLKVYLTKTLPRHWCIF